jgi:hypothetical protein
MYTIESGRGNLMRFMLVLGMLFFMIFLPSCGSETPTEPDVATLNLNVEGLVTLDGLPKSDVRLVLRDYGSGSVFSELKEVQTGEDGRYSLEYGLLGDASRFRLYLYVIPPPGSGTNFYDVSTTEELQIINFEFTTD